eukprot:106195-Hanusia_phi.AAC.1
MHHAFKRSETFKPFNPWNFGSSSWARPSVTRGPGPGQHNRTDSEISAEHRVSLRLSASPKAPVSSRLSEEAAYRLLNRLIASSTCLPHWAGRVRAQRRARLTVSSVQISYHRSTPGSLWVAALPTAAAAARPSEWPRHRTFLD